MSDYASITERARKVFASVSRLESELAREPEDFAVQINLASMRKLAVQARAELDQLAAYKRIEVCDYRVVPQEAGDYAVGHVASSLLTYQLLFSQIFDCLKNGKKRRARIGKEAGEASALDFAYSYSGSLAVVLLAKSERDFFSGSLDEAIGGLYQSIGVSSADDVRGVAQEFGEAVVKRIHDWSAANADGGFSADVRWKRSDGRLLGEVVDRSKMERIVEIIDTTSDEKSVDRSVRGMLVAVSFPARTFHIVVPDGESYKGAFAEDFDVPAKMTAGQMYDATITIKDKYHYATEDHTKRHLLRRLAPFTGQQNFEDPLKDRS